MVSQNQLRPVIKIQESQPLSPMQPDVLSHSLSAAHSGGTIEQVQVIGTLPREINVAAFHRTWERVVEQHAILRTGFHWDGLQLGREVRPRVRFHFEHKDWRGLTEHGQKSRLAAYLQAERRRGFTLSAPPLMRLTLFRLGQAKYILAWTFRQLLLDSCAAVALLNNVFRLYKAFCREPHCEPLPPRPYRHSIGVMRWSSSQFDNKRIKLNSRTARSAKKNPMAENEENTTYKVVVNHEEQYAIRPAHRANAPHWRDTGKTGDHAECLQYIKSFWTDMRPLSLRKKIAEASPQKSAA